MQNAPEQERPVRTMPYTADNKNDHGVQICKEQAFPTAAQWNIDIFRKELRQRDMPALPEITDRQRFVGRIEVDGEIDVQHHGNTNSHITVTAEIKIDLKRIKQHHQKPVHCCGHAKVTVPPCDSCSKGVSKHDLLEQAEAENFYTAGQVVPVDLFSVKIIELLHKVHRFHQRAHQQLGKICDVGQIIDQVCFEQFLTVHRDKICDLLEREKTDAHWQKQSFQGMVCMEQCIVIGDCKVEVLKIEQQRSIDADRYCQEKTPPTELFALKQF